MQIKEVQTREEISKTQSILGQIYENLNKETYIDDILNMMQRGYRLAAVLEKSNCIGVIGVRVTRKLRYGKILEIEDFMIDRKKRGIGVGKMLIRWAEWQATVFGCKNIIGNLETKRLESQKIYSREKFILDGLFFRKEC